MTLPPLTVAGPLALVAPTLDLHSAWLEAYAEWPVPHWDGAGRQAGDDPASVEGFQVFVDRLRRAGDVARLAPGAVPATFWWIVDAELHYLGAITLRHVLTEGLAVRGGHIGFSVRPSARRQGVLTWALDEVLKVAGQLGLTRVLLTCDDANVASAAAIEGAGGQLVDVCVSDVSSWRRYWIPVG